MRGVGRACAVRAIVAVSGSAAAPLEGLPMPLHVVENGADLAACHAARNDPDDLRQRLGISEGAVVARYAGRLLPHKGIHVLMEAARRAMSRNPSLHLMILGDNPDHAAGDVRGQLEQQAASWGFGERIHLAGWVPAVERALVGLHFVVIPSTCRECCSRSLIESLCLGLPVPEDGSRGGPRGDESVALGRATRAATGALLLLALCGTGCREAPRQWSIGIYRGATPFDLVLAERNPVLTAADLGIDGEFVADPFLLPRGDGLFLIFEVWRRSTKQGDIAWAERTSAGAWRFGGLALDEPFHSHPFVFEHDGEVYMVPESRVRREVRPSTSRVRFRAASSCATCSCGQALRGQLSRAVGRALLPVYVPRQRHAGALLRWTSIEMRGGATGGSAGGLTGGLVRSRAMPVGLLLATGCIVPALLSAAAAHARQPQLEPPGTGEERAALWPQRSQHTHGIVVGPVDTREIEDGDAAVHGIEEDPDGVAGQRPDHACAPRRVWLPADHEPPSSALVPPRRRGGWPRGQHVRPTGPSHVSSPAMRSRASSAPPR